MSNNNLKFLPTYLEEEEIENPYLASFHFSDAFNVMYAKKIVETWMNALYSNGSWNIEPPANLLYFYERMLRLLEALWLINQMDNTHRQANLELANHGTHYSEIFCPSSDPEYAWETFPRSLSKAEYVNPYKVFQEVFKIFSIDQWKEELYRMLKLALSEESMQDTEEYFDLLTCKGCFDKMIDACYLIALREFRSQ